LVTPLKPLEAMAQGRIVLASDVGGHRELIADGRTGRLFAPEDPAALAAAIERTIDERGAWPALRAAARRFVEGQRSWNAVAAGYAPVYTAARAATVGAT
jgi:glycosyltransferase involved in cell wall biosynthesis